MVKERIYKYLLEAGRGVEASQILRDALNIHSPNAHSSDSVLAGFLKQDPRFLSTGGFWHLSPISRVPGGLGIWSSYRIAFAEPKLFQDIAGFSRRHPVGGRPMPGICGSGFHGYLQHDLFRD